MATGPNVWNIGDDVVIELSVLDPNTSLGLTGQSSFITLTIKRASDSKYWTGSTYTTTFTTLTMTEVDATNEPGRYRYTLAGGAGNPTANKYYVHSTISNPPTIEGDDYEIHVSRDLTVNVYETEPV